MYKNDDKHLEKAFNNEPIFVLLARDPTAPAVIAEWVRRNAFTQPAEKLVEALKWANTMRDQHSIIKARIANDKRQTEKLANFAENYGAGIKKITELNSTVIGRDRIPGEFQINEVKPMEHKLHESIDVIKWDGRTIINYCDTVYLPMSDFNNLEKELEFRDVQVKGLQHDITKLRVKEQQNINVFNAFEKQRNELRTVISNLNQALEKKDVEISDRDRAVSKVQSKNVELEKRVKENENLLQSQYNSLCRQDAEVKRLQYELESSRAITQVWIKRNSRLSKQLEKLKSNARSKAKK